MTVVFLLFLCGVFGVVWWWTVDVGSGDRGRSWGMEVHLTVIFFLYYVIVSIGSSIKDLRIKREGVDRRLGRRVGGCVETLRGRNCMRILIANIYIYVMAR